MSFPTTSAPLARALAERNYDQPTPVQIAVLADEAADRDLLVSAQTGSGKTVAYGLAIASNLLDGAERFEPAAEKRQFRPGGSEVGGSGGTDARASTRDQRVSSLERRLYGHFQTPRAQLGRCVRRWQGVPR